VKSALAAIKELMDRDDLIGFFTTGLVVCAGPMALVVMVVLWVSIATTPNLADCHTEGYLAGRDGLPAQANPHGAPNSSTVAYEAWARGWAAGFRERRKADGGKVGPDKPPSPVHQEDMP
jgi:hypothetical protein